jgi:serine/threonine-protein kinase
VCDVYEGKLAAYHDAGVDGDTPYLVMSYLIGTSLESYVAVRPLDLDEAKRIVAHVRLGLRALHERGIVHRDLKPGNVFIRLLLPRGAGEEFKPEHRDPKIAPFDEAVLIDFGIARRVAGPATDELEGTVGFLAPEQARVDPIDAKTDVYALAATVFAAMTGRRFFQSSPTQTAALWSHANVAPFDDDEVRRLGASLPRKLRELLREATALEARDRPDVDRFAERFAAL